MNVIIGGIALILGWKWGDWRNWEKYYPTILFMIVGNFLYNILTYNYPMWLYEEKFLPNHTLIEMVHSFVVFPVVVLIFLPRFPEKNISQKIGYVLRWVIIFVSVEWLMTKFNLFTYHNGWNIGWSILFNIVMFTTLRIHYKKPLLAWVISVFVVIFLMVFFDVPIDKMK
jgi:hypothetical protein